MATRALVFLHSVVEILGGVAMVTIPNNVFPIFTKFIGTESEEYLIQSVGQSFGVAIIALGITALVAAILKEHNSFSLRFGALSYHGLISSLLLYGVFRGVPDTKQKIGAACFHGFFMLLFLINIQKNRGSKKEKDN
eukprot:TRINITY_DN163_c0_g1_i1.p1 TRINITY_DN163_c0_g1~~TRINITY_DN163_c0_g1_i1.p1  ORF type:complete len:137 (-),score=39.61 TRINITY_DN163_c0_g1_i1:154-564(-)